MMQLNKYIPDDELPNALKRKLVFGDREQIEALYCVERKIDCMMTEKAMREDGTLKKYMVCVSVEGEYCEEVWAVSQSDACDNVDVGMSDMDIDWTTSAREVTGPA